MGQVKTTEFLRWLRAPMDGRVFRVFRVLFGLCMVYEMLDYFKIDLIGEGFLAPQIHFTYDLFEWVRPLSSGTMHAILWVMLICAVFLTVGIFLKWTCRVFAVLYAYFFLIEKAYYNNHLYLFLLLLLLLSFSEDNFKFGKKSGWQFNRPVARWTVFIVQMQVLIVYFYGGLAKLNSDWLFRQEPVRAMLGGQAGELTVYFFAVGGLLVDLLAPMMMFVPRFRKFAILGYAGFHICNAWMFSDIGVFPFVMLAGLLLFYEASELRWFENIFGKNNLTELSTTKNKLAVPTIEYSVKPLTNWSIGFLSAYFLFQILFPLRGFLLPNPMDYTTIGNRFSWRMKIDTRLPDEMSFQIKSASDGAPTFVPVTQILNDMQLAHLATDPRSVIQFSKYLRGVAQAQGMSDAAVFGKIKFGYNGRSASDFIDPTTNLAAKEVDAWKKISWLILPPK